RPPFAGEDPLEILDRLRTEDPVSLTSLDPTIPAELAGIVERAMRKDPAHRFASLEEMRMQLDEGQRRLGEEAQLVRGRLRERYTRLRELQRVLAGFVGTSHEEEAVPVADERGRLAPLLALEKLLLERISDSQAKIEHAEMLASAFERGAELLQDS